MKKPTIIQGNRRILAARLQDLITRFGTSAEAVSLAAGLSTTAVGDILREKVKNPRSRTLNSIAQVLNTDVAYLLGEHNIPPRGSGPTLLLLKKPPRKELFEFTPIAIPVIGIAEVGAFRMRDDQNQKLGMRYALPYQRHPTVRHFALLVRGHMPGIAPQGVAGYALCADFNEVDEPITDEEVYVVERTQGDAYETTLRRAHVNSKGIELARIGAGADEEPIRLAKGAKADDANTVAITGIAYGLFTPFGKTGL
jgi:transcriptional regulator with XRE-family HTH domain